MLTLPEILANCEEYGECLLWKGSTTGARRTGTPRLYAGGGCHSCRRLVFDATGRTLAEGNEIVAKCGERLCLEPDHLVQRTPSQLHKGRRLTMAHIAACTASSRNRSNSKVTPEIVREIRQSTGTCRELAQRLGLNHSHVAKIRKGERWGTVRGASVFPS